MLIDVVLFLTGILIGGMNAVAGGGNLVGFPVLVSLGGLAPIVANATSYLATLPGQLSSAFGYRKFIKKAPKIYLLLLVPCVFGAAIGATILKNISFEQFDRLIPLLILLAVLIFALQPYVHIRFKSNKIRRPKKNLPILLAGLALLPLTVYAGFFGPGFGFVILATLGFAKLREIHQMNGMKNLVSSTIAITVLITLAASGLVDWKLGLIVASGSLVGGYFGSRLAQKISSHWIRVIVIVIGLATTIYLGIRYH